MNWLTETKITLKSQKMKCDNKYRVNRTLIKEVFKSGLLYKKNRFRTKVKLKTINNECGN
jgi:hypothetical protein